MPDAMLGLVVVSRRVSPGRLTKYAWDRLIQWARYLVNTKDIHLERFGAWCARVTCAARASLPADRTHISERHAPLRPTCDYLLSTPELTSGKVPIHTPLGSY